MKKHLRELVKSIEREGVTVAEVELTQEHTKLYCTHYSFKRMFVTSNSPSDLRTGRNVLGLVRRWKKELAA